MTKIHVTILFFAMTGSALFGEFLEETEVLALPEKSFLPSFRDFEFEEAPLNPFVSATLELKNEIEIVSTELFSDFLRNQIKGYIESESPSKSTLLLKNSRMVFIGDTLEIEKAPGVEGEHIALTLESLKSPFAVFTFDEKEFTLSLDPSNKNPDPLKSGPSFSQETVVTRGIIVHSDGWIIAPLRDLNSDQSLTVYIRDIPYPTKLVSTFEEEGLAILKIFNKSSNVILPFVPISFEAPQAGETLYAQGFFGQSLPYAKQVVRSEGPLMPLVEQGLGAVSLNEHNEIVTFNLEKPITQESLLKHLGSLMEIEKPFFKKSLSDLFKASVNIVVE